MTGSDFGGAYTIDTSKQFGEKLLENARRETDASGIRVVEVERRRKGSIGDMRVGRRLIFHRHRDGVAVRYSGGFRVDGRPVRERAVLGPAASVAGDDFAFAIESVGARMGRL